MSLEPVAADLPLHRVRFVGLPPDLHRQTQEHRDAVERELALADAATVGDVSERFTAMRRTLQERFQPFAAEAAGRIEEAIAGGRPVVDVEMAVPADAAAAVEQLAAILDEIDEVCASGALLTLVSPPRVLAYRRWFFGEIARQVRDGGEPLPWREEDPGGEQSDEAADAELGGAAHALRVGDDLDLATAAELRGELAGLLEQGVSRIALDLGRCGFVDSVGISLLVTTHQRCEAAGGELALVGVAGPVRRTLDLAGLLEVLHVR